MSAPVIPLELAQRVGRKLCEDRNVTLVLPGEPYRLLVVYLLAGAYALASLVLGHSVGWSLADVQAGLSITLPGAGRALGMSVTPPSVPDLVASYHVRAEDQQLAEVMIASFAASVMGGVPTTLAGRDAVTWLRAHPA